MYSYYMDIHYFVFPIDLLHVFVYEKALILFSFGEACWNKWIW